jgi:GNAT superfamily N-acetyltransferase
VNVCENIDRFKIRLARHDEIPRLLEIEDEAGKLFAGLGIIDESLDHPFPLEMLAQLIASGYVWVAACDDAPPVGMIIASTQERTVYIEEMDVLPEYGRRGLGAGLLAHVCGWAEACKFEAVVLSTFADIKWNGVFYRKNGFRDLDPSDWKPWMRKVRKDESRRGLAVEARVFMRKDLGRSSETKINRPGKDMSSNGQSNQRTRGSGGLKSAKTFFWIFTGLLAALMLAASIPDVMYAPGAVSVIRHLGYPTYLLPFLGTAKILGVAAILIPGFTKIKEWAYAGLVFDLLGALYSHISAGDSAAQWAFAAIGLTLAAGSYVFFRRKSVRTAGLHPGSSL